jgi:hypothetical protein
MEYGVMQHVNLPRLEVSTRYITWSELVMRLLA